jgi:hypothetical protein
MPCQYKLRTFVSISSTPNSNYEGFRGGNAGEKQRQKKHENWNIILLEVLEYPE